MSLLANLVAETEELAPLLMPPLAFAGVAVGVFVALAFVVWSFRDVANRQGQKANRAGDSHGSGH
ncbi:hypothetical protein [Salinibacterium sp.]|uniref:hypothetical protein n=1 Tax=Salinibacterium sp. TaxID=1915057 RepID=UPI00286C88E7|nr:hypothetical protein [Salinibacterium sp.]